MAGSDTPPDRSRPHAPPRPLHPGRLRARDRRGRRVLRAGSWLGIVWILIAGISSNMAWYYLRKARADRAADHESTGAAG
ncbi:hypothetical protein SVIO_037040 [Streptomyces violaceusniger]|uniref:Uncharacterized protein n=1 Tax=Streptomyces violaceusniger TaxID=68280 RepID=A0A4D4KUS4_STRVO|nr:hypothetical protein SVIO_037040 [Streptomyces violaceusniger]